jgi:hypothetical protein
MVNSLSDVLFKAYKNAVNTESLPFVKRPTNAQGSSGFFY